MAETRSPAMESDRRPVRPFSDSSLFRAKHFHSSLFGLIPIDAIVSAMIHSTWIAMSDRQVEMQDRWLSVDEIAEYLGVSKDTVYGWVTHKGMPGYKVGRFWKFKCDDVDAWVR